MHAGLVTDRILDEEVRAGDGGSFADLCMVVFQVRKSAVSHELVEDVTCAKGS